jgi:hypothetical protein
VTDFSGQGAPPPDAPDAPGLAEAKAKLYAADPDEFTALRQDFVARAADQPKVAKQIAGLRKPTRAAWVLNRLVRAHPDTPARLAELAAALHEGGDGARIRELTTARNHLVDELTRLAIAAAGLTAPPAALREDVTATLGAALADQQVADDLAAGAIVRAAHWAGFGETMTWAPTAPAPKNRSPEKGAAAVPAVADLARHRQEKILSAERSVEETSRALAEATVAEQDLEDEVRGIEDRLEQARLALAQARRDAYRAESRQKKAAAELARLRQ